MLDRTPQEQHEHVAQRKAQEMQRQKDVCVVKQYLTGQMFTELHERILRRDAQTAFGRLFPE